ncbi:MAG: patatin-like phospholipase family protein [Allosphingosinicella sp.]
MAAKKPAKMIAIACQGGGTHAAFSWGVLGEILKTKKAWDAEGDGGRFEIAAISGTSAGALCALATFYGLAPNTADPSCGSIDKAIERLDFLWTTFAATTPIETAYNQLVGNLLELRAQGVPFPASDPYAVYAGLGLSALSMLGARPVYLQFPALLEALCPNFDAVDWKAVAEWDLRVLAGAIEILSGNFEIFDSDKTLEERGLIEAPTTSQYEETRWRMRRAISLEGVAASGTLPEVLPAQVIPNQSFPVCGPGKAVTRNGHYWDGLYSQNPPIRDLLETSNKEHKPDEIWVIRINPQEFRPGEERLSLEDIRDRENDLAGNLSLNQELDHILTVNRWLDKYAADNPLLARYKPIVVRTIKMTRETAWGLRHTSKFDRSVEHLARLRQEGREIARQWLSDWRTLGPDFAHYPDDARYPEGAP